jgi:hypothetical protein
VSICNNFGENVIVSIDLKNSYLIFDSKRGCKGSLHPLIKIHKEGPGLYYEEMETNHIEATL